MWSPVAITIPAGKDLQINLTNVLRFPTGGSPAFNDVPTSIVIDGQLGGGLGASRTTSHSPPHTSHLTAFGSLAAYSSKQAVELRMKVRLARPA